jgi:hypothetical protein
MIIRLLGDYRIHFNQYPTHISSLLVYKYVPSLLLSSLLLFLLNILQILSPGAGLLRHQSSRTLPLVPSYSSISHLYIHTRARIPSPFQSATKEILYSYSARSSKQWQLRISVGRLLKPSPRVIHSSCWLAIINSPDNRDRGQHARACYAIFLTNILLNLHAIVSI